LGLIMSSVPGPGCHSGNWDLSSVECGLGE
jgi:hypothetical protein